MKKLVRFMVLLKPKNDPFHESVFLFKFLQAGHLFKEKRALKCPLLFIFNFILRFLFIYVLQSQ